MQPCMTTVCFRTAPSRQPEAGAAGSISASCSSIWRVFASCQDDLDSLLPGGPWPTQSCTHFKTLIDCELIRICEVEALTTVCFRTAPSRQVQLAQLVHTRCTCTLYLGTLLAVLVVRVIRLFIH